MQTLNSLSTKAFAIVLCLVVLATAPSAMAEDSATIATQGPLVVGSPLFFLHVIDYSVSTGGSGGEDRLTENSRLPVSRDQAGRKKD